jgi:hypothetical protein
MHMMDTNKDGLLSTAELAAGAHLMFDELDADRDGRVTAAEMDAALMELPVDPHAYGTSSPSEHGTARVACLRGWTPKETDFSASRRCGGLRGVR